MPRFRPLHHTAVVLRVLAYCAAGVLVAAGLSVAALETGWGKNLLRRFIIREAANYLTATLDIGRLDGSLFRGLTLGDVRLSQGGATIVSIDEASVSYSLRQFLEPSLTISRVHLTKPRVVAAKLADGRWNLATLVKRERPDRERSGPGRPIRVLSIDVIDGDVDVRDELALGAVRVPQRYEALNASFAFDYRAGAWRANFASLSWTGGAGRLTVDRLTGAVSDGPAGWQFDNLSVRTPQSAFVVSGVVKRDVAPTSLDIHAVATEFAFEEWAGVLDGLKNIAVEGSFSLAIAGPAMKLATDVNLKSADSGDVHASLVLDTSVPGWHAAGRADVARFDLSHWLNRTERQSNITGLATFDVDLDLGRHFPRGSFSFSGPHAAYIGYEASDLKARGTLTSTDALIADATGVAYGSAFHITSGSVGIDAPNAYQFRGSDTGMDLTRLPPQVPITHVESRIALDTFDVSGQFDTPSFIKGGATFGESEYLGAAIAPGATGTIDTSFSPAHYTGEGDISHIDIHHFGEGLNTEWMLTPRWAGIVSGHVHVAGEGIGGPAMKMDGGGRLERADMFNGRLLDADVTVHIAEGSLTGTYDGRLEQVDGERAFADPRFAATITGAATAAFAVRDLLVRDTTMADYDVDGTLNGERSVLRGIPIDSGSITARMTGTTINVAAMRADGPSLDVQGAGLLELDGEHSSNFHYVVGSADLALARDSVGDVSGTITTTGTLTGPLTAIHVSGDASVDNAGVNGTTVASTTAQYDVTIPTDAPAKAVGKVTASATELVLMNREFPSADATLAFNNGQIDVDVTLAPQADSLSPIPTIAISGAAKLHPDDRALDLSRLTLAIGKSPAWQLANPAPAPTISWSDKGIQTAPLEFSDSATGDQRVSISGSWLADGSGALHVTGSRVSLDALIGEPGRPSRYGGSVDLDATIRGTRDHPKASAQVDVTDGRVRQLTYQKLGGHVDYEDGRLDVDLRLDQAPGVWLTAKGAIPIGVIESDAPDTPINLAIASSTVGLGLLEGVTDVVRDVSGQMTLNVNVSGTSQAPHFAGTIALANAAFLVTSTGARYKNGRASLDLATDRVNVSSFHLEDRGGRSLDVTGSLGTEALTVGEIHIDVSASHFEVLRNATGNVDVNAKLTLRGDLNAPRIAGDVTILSGELKVDEIFEQALFQPYATEAAAPSSPSTSIATAGTPALQPVDAIAALNPWDRLGLDVSIHSPGTLRLTGDNVQVAQGTPLGLGSFNLHATGDLYIYKDPGQPPYITGSYDSISGSYSFQGRRFDMDPTSSITFRGDFNPEMYVTVNRVITGVETKVTIAGTLRQPELRLSSNPPLESSDILSLIVFNQSASDLSAPQQQELAVRAGTLAYGFVATPLVAALQRSLGLDTLEIAPPSSTLGPSVTVGNELVPGLVAQFTRGFGQEAYDEATIEYYLSRIFHIRATFSDAQSLVAISPFRRIERAGIDFLIFFSF